MLGKLFIGKKRSTVRILVHSYKKMEAGRLMMIRHMKKKRKALTKRVTQGTVSLNSEIYLI